MRHIAIIEKWIKKSLIALSPLGEKNQYRQAENAVVFLHPQLQYFSALSIPKITFAINHIISTFYDTNRSRFQSQRRKNGIGGKEEHLYAQLIDFEVQRHAFN